MTDKKNFPFFLFSLVVFTALLLPSLLQDGMFMDGMLYSTTSKNLAEGKGSWWHLLINKYYLSSYFDQPPLTIWIQSFFFRILGGSIYTERIYSFTMACFTGWMIIKIWNLIYDNQPEIKKVSWLPFLFWIIIPLCFWTYANNMVECTMSVFILASVYVILKGFKTQAPLLWLIAGGIFIFLSSFCKGIQGMFPLVFAGICWLVYRQCSFFKMLFYSFILFVIPALIYFLIFQIDAAVHYYKEYFQGRLYTAFHPSGHYTTDSHFYILIRLVSELLIPAAICLVMIFVFRKKSIPFEKIKPNWKPVYLFLLLGLCGSLPLMITLEQRRFYLVPTVPFFAIALASIIAPGVALLIGKINTGGNSFRIFKGITVALFCGVLIFSAMQIGKTRRDKEMLHDIHEIGKIIPRGTDINMHPAFDYNWSLQLYFTRHFNISLAPIKDHQFQYLIVPDSAKADLTKYSEVPLDLKMYKLYKLLN